MINQTKNSIKLIILPFQKQYILARWPVVAPPCRNSKHCRFKNKLHFHTSFFVINTNPGSDFQTKKYSNVLDLSFKFRKKKLERKDEREQTVTKRTRTLPPSGIGPVYFVLELWPVLATVCTGSVCSFFPLARSVLIPARFVWRF